MFQGGAVNLQGSFGGSRIVYYWTPDYYITGSAWDINTSVAPLTDTTYTLHVESQDGCGSATDEVFVRVFKKITIPNVFSPNGDGMNDYFYPRGKGFTIKSLRIFSRWGNVVFEQSNFVPNNQSYGWNGTYKGKVLQPDVYVFLIEVVCDNGQIFASKGNITLLR
jgi:gliding motility-associated-like protein